VTPKYDDPVISFRAPREILERADTLARERGQASRSSVLREALVRGLSAIEPRTAP